MKRLTLLGMACLTAVSILSCGQEDYWSKRVPIFKVVGPNSLESGSIDIDGKTQTLNFKVLATEEWTATVSDDIYKLNPATGGTGNTSVSLSAPSNESGNVRSLSVTFASASGRESVFNLTQQAQQPYLETDVHDVSVSADGEEFTVNIDTNQPEWAYELAEGSSWIMETSRTSGSVTFSVPENNSGRKRSADIRFYAAAAPELMDYVSVSQNIPVVAPKADLLDVVFASDRSASDVSGMGMEIRNDRLNADVTTSYNDRYGCYAARFNNSTVGRSALDAGYYYIPYTSDSKFGAKLADGFSYELLFCSYTDPTALQVKPFSSTQAGGTGMCFRASTGEINFEVHVGGSWCELYSGVLPQKNQYYHVVATWDKENGLAMLYVDGKLTASKNTSGDFKFMTTNVDKRWFGIGADPSANDSGEASFYGEVVFARLYDAPMSQDEAKALYKLVK